MQKESNNPSIHERMKILIEEMVEKELPLKEALREFEKVYIETTAKRYKQNKTRMAQALGIHRNTLHNLCKTLKIR